MKNHIFKIFLLLLVVSFLTLNCTKGEEQTSAAETVEKTAEQNTESSTKISPAELGQEIAELYGTTMLELTELLKDKPAIAEISDEVSAMKEDCVKKMVEFGKQRELLDDAGKAKVDSQISIKMSSLYNDPVWTSYNEIQQYYFKDRDFHKTILSFNIITQYSNFDLLKEQEPEEASRLGIE